MLGHSKPNRAAGLLSGSPSPWHLPHCFILDICPLFKYIYLALPSTPLSLPILSEFHLPNASHPSLRLYYHCHREFSIGQCSGCYHLDGGIKDRNGFCCFSSAPRDVHLSAALWYVPLCSFVYLPSEFFRSYPLNLCNLFFHTNQLYSTSINLLFGPEPDLPASSNGVIFLPMSLLPLISFWPHLLQPLKHPTMPVSVFGQVQYDRAKLADRNLDLSAIFSC